MYKRVVAVGNACLINDLTFWVGYVTLFTRDASLFEVQIFKRDAGRSTFVEYLQGASD
jgi:hypothetical protein